MPSGGAAARSQQPVTCQGCSSVQGAPLGQAARMMAPQAVICTAAGMPPRKRKSARQAGIPARQASSRPIRKPAVRQPSTPQPTTAAAQPSSRHRKPVPPLLALQAALLQPGIDVAGTWPDLSIAESEWRSLLAFIAWRVLPVSETDAYWHYPEDAWKLFANSRDTCLLPVKARQLRHSPQAERIRQEQSGWLASATCARTRDGRWYLRLSAKQPTDEERTALAEQFCGAGDSADSRRREILAAFGKRLTCTLHVHRLLCWAYQHKSDRSELLYGTECDNLAAHECHTKNCLCHEHLSWSTASENNHTRWSQVRARKVKMLSNLGEPWIPKHWRNV